MGKNKSKLLLIITLICFSLFGIWFVYKKSSNDKLVFKDAPASEEPLLKPTPEPEKNSIKVYIVGEVLNPGVYEAEEGARIEDVVAAAGGFTDMADDRNVNLAAKVSDGQQIVIYNKDERNAFSGPDGNNIGSGKININTATAGELAELAGIGEAKANAIVKYREANGSFASIEAVKNVDGIGDKIFDGIKDSITTN